MRARAGNEGKTVGRGRGRSEGIRVSERAEKREAREGRRDEG